MSSLRLIKESELRRGGIIGSGAFGTVYKVIMAFYISYLVQYYGTLKYYEIVNFKFDYC